MRVKRIVNVIIYIIVVCMLKSNNEYASECECDVVAASWSCVTVDCKARMTWLGGGCFHLVRY